MIEPSSADHSVATLNRNGVRLLPLLGDELEREVVGEERALHRDEREQRAGRDEPDVQPRPRAAARAPRHEPDASVTAPPTDAAKPRTTPAVPSAAFIARYGASAGTRSGFSSLYSEVCFTRIRSLSNVSACPVALEHDRDPGLEQLGRIALVLHRHRHPVEPHVERDDVALVHERAGNDRALQAEALVPSSAFFATASSALRK